MGRRYLFFRGIMRKYIFAFAEQIPYSAAARIKIELIIKADLKIVYKLGK